MNRNPFRRLLARLRRCEGANLLEAAIVTPLILILTIGMIEFASVFYVFLALQNGVGQATRFGVTGATMGTSSRVDSIKAAMRQATPTLTIPDNAFTFSHMPEGGTSWVGGTGGPNAIERVSVAYTWTFFTPLMQPFFPSGRMTLNVDATMKNEGKWE
jgi:Flp pilus assembly protein TadG